MDWKPIETFDPDKLAGIGVLGYFPTINCVQDMVWLYDGHNDRIGFWCSWSGDGEIEDKPSHWRMMPDPPSSEAITLKQD